MAITVDICYTDSKPGYSWANIIELDDGWTLVGLLPTRFDTTEVLREFRRATRSAVHRSTLSCGVPVAGRTGMQMHSVATLHWNGCLRACIAHICIYGRLPLRLPQQVLISDCRGIR